MVSFTEMNGCERMTLKELTEVSRVFTPRKLFTAFIDSNTLNVYLVSFYNAIFTRDSDSDYIIVVSFPTMSCNHCVSLSLLSNCFFVSAAVV